MNFHAYYSNIVQIVDSRTQSDVNFFKNLLVTSIYTKISPHPPKYVKNDGYFKHFFRASPPKLHTREHCKKQIFLTSKFFVTNFFFPNPTNKTETAIASRWETSNRNHMKKYFSHPSFRY
jgi:hypothetical protein